MGNIGLEPEITREFLDKQYRRACELLAHEQQRAESLDAQLQEVQADYGRLEEEAGRLVRLRDGLRDEVKRLKCERADLREKFWRELYGLPNPTEIMKRFDRAAGVPE